MKWTIVGAVLVGVLMAVLRSRSPRIKKMTDRVANPRVRVAA